MANAGNRRMRQPEPAGERPIRLIAVLGRAPRQDTDLGASSASHVAKKIHIVDQWETGPGTVVGHCAQRLQARRVEGRIGGGRSREAAMTLGVEKECPTIKAHLVASGMRKRVEFDRSDKNGWHVGAGQAASDAWALALPACGFGNLMASTGSRLFFSIDLSLPM